MMPSSARVQGLLARFILDVSHGSRRNAHVAVRATVPSLPIKAAKQCRAVIVASPSTFSRRDEGESSHWRPAPFSRVARRRSSLPAQEAVINPEAHEDDREIFHVGEGTSEVSRNDSMASLQEILGIKDEEVARLRSDDGARSVLSAPSWKRLVAAGGGRQSLAWFLMNNLKADPKKVRSVALRHPSVLFGKSSSAAVEMSRYLQEALGMDRATVTRVILRFPQCARLSVETIEPKVRWLRDNICTDHQGVIRIISLTPQLLGRSIEEALEPQLMWLQVRFRLPAAKAARLLRTVPVLFTCCPEKNLEHMTRWLKERIGLEDDDVAAMITAAPTILTMNPVTGVEPKLIWLRDHAGLTEEEVRKLVRSCPAILKRSIARSLEPKLGWLRETLGLSPGEVKILLLRCPNVTGASLDGNLRHKLPWLTNKVGLTREEAVTLMSRNPVVMLLSIENNLEPTLRFYRDHMGASAGDLRRAMMQNPRLLATSLEGRLLPRAAAMRAHGIKLRFKEHQSHVGVLSDAKFDAYVANYRSRSSLT